MHCIQIFAMFLHTMFLLQSLGVMAATYSFDKSCNFLQVLRIESELTEAKSLSQRTITRIDELIAAAGNPAPNEADDAAITVFNKVFGDDTSPSPILNPAIREKVKGRTLLSKPNVSGLTGFLGNYESLMLYQAAGGIPAEKTNTRIYCANGQTVEWKPVPDREEDGDKMNSLKEPHLQETFNPANKIRDQGYDNPCIDVANNVAWVNVETDPNPDETQEPNRGIMIVRADLDFWCCCFVCNC